MCGAWAGAWLSRPYRALDYTLSFPGEEGEAERPPGRCWSSDLLGQDPTISSSADASRLNTPSVFVLAQL